MAIENVDAIDESRSNTVRNRLFGLQFCLPDWRQMVNSSDLRSTFIDCSEPSRLSPIRCNKVAYLMIIEYFGHFSIKHKQRYLNSQRISVSRLKWQLSPLQSCFIGNRARGQWLVNGQPIYDTLLTKMYNCQRLKHLKFLK